MRTPLVLLVGLLLVGGAAADPDDTGWGPDMHHEFPDDYAYRDCTVYVYNDGMSEAERIQSLGYTVTVGYDMSYATISGYDVVFIPLIGPGGLSGYEDDIEQYVAEGGGLWIHQPNGYGWVDYAPPGFEFNVTDIFYCYPYEGNRIVDAGHPTMAGLAASDLVGRFDTVYITDLGSGYGLIADGYPDCATDVHCAAGIYGECGKVFMDLGNLNPGSFWPGSNQYIINIIDWLCTGGFTPADSDTWGTIKEMFK